MATKISGTKEWSKHSCNIILGCPHQCRYCYARAMAVQRGQIASPDEWGTTYWRLRPKEVAKGRKKLDGRVMFPTTHDITPEHLGQCGEVLLKLLQAGNDVLIVSKPHYDCIKTLCDNLRRHRTQIMFRFSIGARDDNVLWYWEPGAPAFEERLASLKYAYLAGYATSVSAEPLLNAGDVRGLFDAVKPWVSDSIWIGKLNGIASRVAPGTSLIMIDRIKAGQTDDAVRAVYAELKDEPLVRWKESYKEVLGLTVATEAGQDV